MNDITWVLWGASAACWIIASVLSVIRIKNRQTIWVFRISALTMVAISLDIAYLLGY